MIKTEITININRKADIEQIEQKIIGSQIQSPIFVREYEHSYQIDFTSDYEQWELDNAILECFPGYAYTSGLERGRKEIRLQISRYQSPYSTDGWGRQIEDPVNQTKYLVKKTVEKPERFSPEIKVLFGDEAQYYYVNIINGVKKSTDERDVLLIDDFKTRNENTNAPFFNDRLYPSPHEAFDSAYYKMQDLVEADFKFYLEKKKKETTAIQKIPRKIIRDFIKACNNGDIDEVLKKLHENMSFEKLLNHKTTIRIDGMIEFKEYLRSPDQPLCGKDFTIRSSWHLELPIVSINLRYFPRATGQEINPVQKHLHIQFKLEDGKIIRIIVAG